MKEWLKRYEEGASPYEIAEEFNTYPNKVRRFLKKHTTLRNKGEAQSIALKSGRKKHPTSGKKRSAKDKAKISSGINQFWDTISEDKYGEIVEISRKNWFNRSKKDRTKIQQAANEAVRKASKDGSKAELYVAEIIKEAGFSVSIHRKDLIKNHNLEIDLYIPELSTIIEVDGPSHFVPIWGEEALQKATKADNEKAGLVLQSGFVLIRIKYLVKNLTEKAKRSISKQLLTTLNDIKNKFPEENDRFIQIEVS
jgi:very-short-patch-repair endonuclease